ncbi:hypothetical protein [Pseudomonas sp. BN414]|uniref:hypothetical protein n=1 Tax=Pseudomonas sp. BN414 TaxID=2567888 RepID=UPI002457BAD4|nr:hypothetical protein [Pseudomonas sp. BN414]
MHRLGASVSTFSEKVSVFVEKLRDHRLLDACEITAIKINELGGRFSAKAEFSCQEK